MKVEYIYIRDYYDDDNDGFIYGVQEVNKYHNIEYVQWFKTIKDLKANTKKLKLKVTNEKEFFLYLKKLKLN